MQHLRHLATALLMLSSLGASAHKASDAYLRLQVHGHELSLRADIALRDLDRELVLDADDDGQLRWGEIRSRSADIEAMAERGMQLMVHDEHGAACTPIASAPLQIEHHSDGRYAVVVRRWQCAGTPTRAELDYTLFATTDPTHRGILLQQQSAAAHPQVIAPGGPPVALSLSPAPGEASRAWLGIFEAGVHHIWVGLDHVLFLTALLLPAVLRREGKVWLPAQAWRPALMNVLGVVTAFTVAHSITLGLAAFDLVNPPSRWIESLIALSVLLAALNNIWPVMVETRWRLTFAFGLVHGFGFAGPLRDLGLSRAELAMPLLLFNLGVEAGQLAIVAVLVPAAWAARRWRGYRCWVLGAGSLAVAVLALAWLVERLFDVQLPGVGA
ncbi:HupE/UreJ family protein [Paucibacter sp. R3-3]|uniref:HupE/UreJ family protein n=1 Tax=Roseateles agri TaxID=3098619 RepID=A0ABU5DNT7_9BURK|nr:HupE/UreJ family protein [Paucibacter sp. R3-3]MDY0747971.1 HupE/UreJ family protein [Paucibacter sp. R3-3]